MSKRQPPRGIRNEARGSRGPASAENEAAEVARKRTATIGNAVENLKQAVSGDVFAPGVGDQGSDPADDDAKLARNSSRPADEQTRAMMLADNARARLETLDRARLDQEASRQIAEYNAPGDQPQ